MEGEKRNFPCVHQAQGDAVTETVHRVYERGKGRSLSSGLVLLDLFSCEADWR